LTSLASITEDDALDELLFAAPAVLPPTADPDATERCHACRELGGAPHRRWLCPRCYHDGPTRSCYSTDGRRIAWPEPDGRPGGPSADLFVPLPIAPRGDWWGDDTADDEAIRPRPLKRMPRGRLSPAELAAQDRADEAKVLAVVDDVTQAGTYLADDGQPAAGVSRVQLSAAIGDKTALLAIDRLVTAGVLSVVQARGPAGRRGKSVRRPAPRS
jgi:phage gp46-like protein